MDEGGDVVRAKGVVVVGPSASIVVLPTDPPWTVNNKTCNWPSMFASLEFNSAFLKITLANKTKLKETAYHVDSSGLELTGCLDVRGTCDETICLHDISNHKRKNH